MASAFFLSHNCIGDNIINIGAIHELLKYYQEIFFICKNKYLENLKLLYTDKRVRLVPINENDEINEYHRILDPLYQIEDIDILVAGYCVTPFFKKKINNIKLINRKQDKSDKIHERFEFVKVFYEDIHLDLKVFFLYTDIESTDESIKLYNDIQKYNIVFMHTQSTEANINLKHIVNKFINKDNYIIICANYNVYNNNNNKYKNKYIITQKYTNILIQKYINIIKNAKYIFIIDSCFSPIILKLLFNKQINKKYTHIYNRYTLQVI